MEEEHGGLLPFADVQRVRGGDATTTIAGSSSSSNNTDDVSYRLSCSALCAACLGGRGRTSDGLLLTFLLLFAVIVDDFTYLCVSMSVCVCPFFVKLSFFFAIAITVFTAVVSLSLCTSVCACLFVCVCVCVSVRVCVCVCVNALCFIDGFTEKRVSETPIQGEPLGEGR